MKCQDQNLASKSKILYSKYSLANFDQERSPKNNKELNEDFKENKLRVEMKGDQLMQLEGSLKSEQFLSQIRHLIKVQGSGNDGNAQSLRDLASQLVKGKEGSKGIVERTEQSVKRLISLRDHRDLDSPSQSSDSLVVEVPFSHKNKASLRKSISPRQSSLPKLSQT